ncbi:unnamed protein product [Calypogeia fissa]
MMAEVEKGVNVLVVPEAEIVLEAESVTKLERASRVVETDAKDMVDDIDLEFIMDFAELPDVEMPKDFTLGSEVIGLPYWAGICTENVVMSEHNERNDRWALIWADSLRDTLKRDMRGSPWRRDITTAR